MTQTFWLSFCDNDLPTGQQFLGACVVDVTSEDAKAIKPELPPQAMTGSEWIAAACRKAWRMGCNPGGEVASARIDNLPGFAKHKDDHPRNVLLSKADIQAGDATKKKTPHAAKPRKRQTR